ncbi:MAG: hypothetical protein JRI59_04135 [Deltaproteobacteria bacterium]|nr:hypothetical protein [Deltaproteobacteria bacterium]
MTYRFFTRFSLPLVLGAACLIGLALPLMGCGKGPPHSQAVRTFRTQIQKELQRLVPALSEPVATQDKAAIDRALAQSFAQAEEAGRPPWFRVGVLDPLGTVLARYPDQELSGLRFSNYRAVKEVIRKKRVVSQVLYFADHSQAYIILAPLLSRGKLVGMVGILLNAAEVQAKWQVSPAEFRQLDFN